MYNVDRVLKLLGQTPAGKRAYIYARVSSAKQFEDLDRQVQDLQKACPGHIVIKDVGSGVNFHRKGLQTLLELVLSGMVSEVTVMHRDRLARIGYELLEFFFNKTGVKLVVLGGDAKDAESELADDLLAVTTLFVASHNGRRSAENKKRRRVEEENKALESGSSEARSIRTHERPESAAG